VRRTAALIVGGGPAGCAAAIRLAQGGVRPLLIERSEGPRDVVCGGFLGWDALAALGRLGIDPAALGARPIRRLRLVTARRTVEAALPRPAAGLSRRTLDTALLAAAAGAGAELLRGRAARAADAQARLVRMEDGEEIAADALLLATGKHELRGAERGPRLADAPLGLRATVAAGSGLEGVIELHLFDGGYAGLLLQEDGTANLCFSISRARFKDAGGIEPLVAALADELPALRARMTKGPSTAWSAVAGIPYGWRGRTTSPGLYRVGDQAAVIASIAGDGIAIALESGIAAGDAILAGTASGAFQQGFARRSARPIRLAEVLRRSAERGATRALLVGLFGLAPGLASHLARLTRIAG
jgi:flavin-dependent dehydrogenase